MSIIESLNFQKDNTPPSSSTWKSISKDEHIPRDSKIIKDHISLKP